MRPQDLLVLLRLSLVGPGERWTYQQLSMELGMSVSEVHAAVRRGIKSMLVVRRPEGDAVNRSNLLEFVVHGVKYAFPPERGQLTRGIPTAHAVSPLKEMFVHDLQPPVWPHPEGSIRGEGLEPIYRSAPGAALKNHQLYELLALVDAVRAGCARERELAKKELEKRLLDPARKTKLVSSDSPIKELT